MPSLQVRLIDSLASIEAGQWDALTGGRCSISRAFLTTLEASGCVGGDSGWSPQHITLWDGEQLAGAMPLYEKQHSFGEYVFDWAWADAYQRHGLPYYPKWLSAVPFSPIPGSRLLARDAAVQTALLEVAERLADESALSSIHVLFPQADEATLLGERGWMIRSGIQFHWCNRGYMDFDAFLAALNHEKRKKIRQERRRAAAHGLNIHWLDGHTASRAQWDFFYQCYATTYALHRSTPYLTPEFFPALAAAMPDNLRLVVAERDGAPVASAFFLVDEHALYGRYWGARENLPFLHFELCYYQAIEYCIHHGIARFEGGAQGEHKLSRGLEAVVTQSAHRLRDPRFADAVDRFLARETAGIGFYLDELSERSPFRRAPE